MLRCTRQTLWRATLFACGFMASLPANAQQAFNATYTGVANVTGPDTSGYLHVTSTLSDPLASFGLTEAKFAQTVFVYVNPYVINGMSIFQSAGGVGADKLFTSYSGISTPFDPPHGVVVSAISGQFTFKGGTGAFADASGSGTWAGQANIVTGAVTVNFTGTVVPEPDDLALLAGSLVSGGGLWLRRRKTRCSWDAPTAPRTASKASRTRDLETL